MKLRRRENKRKIRKAQQHFRGSSFGQGSAPKTLPETMKSYEYGPNGFSLEDSSGNTTSEQFTPTSINSLKLQISKAISGENLRYNTFEAKNYRSTIVSGLIKSISNISNEDLLEYIIDIEKEKFQLKTTLSKELKT